MINAAYNYVKEHCSECTLNHCLRSVAFGLIFCKKFPPIANNPDIDTENIVISTLLHDMGWATTKSLLSSDKRFEVDGANIARDFITAHDKWDKHRIQLMWDAIALHATPSICQHKEPEVVATGMGVLLDFFGPNLPAPGGSPVTVDEYKEILTAFPRLGFKDELKEIFCCMCRDKPHTTYDNFVCEFGKKYGLDGKGGGKEEFTKRCEENSFVTGFEGALAALEQYET